MTGVLFPSSFAAKPLLWYVHHAETETLISLPASTDEAMFVRAISILTNRIRRHPIDTILTDRSTTDEKDLSPILR